MAEIIPLKTKRSMVDVQLTYLEKTRSFIDYKPLLLMSDEKMDEAAWQAISEDK